MAETAESAPDTQAPGDPDLAGKGATGNPSDGYGSKTASAGTEILRVIPPFPTLHSRVNAFTYEAAATAHTLTMMVRLAKTTVYSEAAAGQLVIKFAAIPTMPDGSALAQGDYVIVKDETGIFNVFKVDSISGLNVTMYASIGSANGSGLVRKILAGVAIHVMGAPADHAERQYTMKASTITQRPGIGYCVSPGTNQPILIHSNNATNAGTLEGPAFDYIKI